MRPSTLLLVTWIIWLTAKKRLGEYWKLATTYAADLPNEQGTGGGSGSSGLSHASLLPDFNNGNLTDLTNILT